MNEHNFIVGALFWVLTYPIWSPRCNRIRGRNRSATRDREELGAWLQSTAAYRKRYTEVIETAVEQAKQARPAYQQDEPYSECFEEDDL